MSQAADKLCNAVVLVSLYCHRLLDLELLDNQLLLLPLCLQFLKQLPSNFLFVEVQLIHNIVLVSSTQQSDLFVYIHIYVLFFRFFPIIGYYKIRNILSCAIQ